MSAPVTSALAAVFVAVGLFGSEISRGPLGLRAAQPGLEEATAEPVPPAVEEEAGARPPPHRAYVRYLASSPGYFLEGVLASPLVAWAIPRVVECCGRRNRRRPAHQYVARRVSGPAMSGHVRG